MRASCIVRPVGSRPALLVVLILAGLAVRLALLDAGGTHDVSYDVSWGQATNRAGFAHYYYGNYFPFQYHIFQLAAWVSSALGVGGATALKAIVLVSDLSIALLLVALADRLRISATVAAIYWVLPYTLAMDWLGYVDFGMALCALLGIYILSLSRGPASTVAAGFAFGAALMMKPQALMLVVVFACYVAALLFRPDRRRPLLRDLGFLALGPIVLFASYSAWLASAGRGVTYLVRTYVEFGKFQGTQFSANMTNIWLLVADAYHHGTGPLYAVNGPHYALYEAIAVVVTGALTIFAAVVIALRGQRRALHEDLVLLFAVATLTLPMTMTRAHENHLFLGFVFGLLAVAMLESRWLTVSFHTIFALQAVALVALYRFGDSGPTWSFVARAGNFFGSHLWPAAGAVTFAAFCVAYASIVARAGAVDWTARPKRPSGSSDSLLALHGGRTGYEPSDHAS